MAALAGTAFVGGAVEAGFLVIVTRTALAISNGRESTGTLNGVTVSVGTATAVAAVLLVVRAALALLGVRLSTTTTFAVSTGLRRRLADAFLRASWATQQSEPSGRLQQLVTQFTVQAIGVVNALTTFVSASLNLLALLVVALVVDPLATVVVVAALFVLGSVLAPIRRRIRLRARSAASASLAVGSSVSELGALGLEMQTYGVRDRFAERISDLIDAEASATRRADFLRGSVVPIYTSLAYGALVAGLAIAASAGLDEVASLGPVMLIMLRALTYAQQLQVASGNLMAAVPFLEQLEATVHHYEAQRAVSGSTVLSGIGQIHATRVGFQYEGGRSILRDVSFTIEPGELIGIIGPSGGGKTTLVQLLLGVREPSTGSISVSGVDLRDVDRRDWTRRVAFVAQDAALFSGTAADNIRFFRDEIDDASIRRAALRANVSTDIDALEHGFETYLGERASQLSGGQRQRLSIARALVGSPELLVLDEPTSALDVQSEALIRETIKGLKGSVTTIIVAHRLSTLEACDRIMVIDEGCLVAFDRPVELRQRSEFYRHALQLSGIE